MLGKALTAGITIFWATMMTLLAQRDILPVWRAERAAARAPNYNRLEALAEKGRSWQMGIYQGEPPAGRRIGRTLSRLRMDGAEVVMTSDTRVLLDLGAGEMPFRFDFEADAVEGQLVGFHLRVLTGASAGGTAEGAPAGQAGPGRVAFEPLASVDGLPVGNLLHLRVLVAGQTHEATAPFDARRMLADLFSPAFTPAQLRVGESWAFSSFNPLSYGLGTALARVTGRERIEVEGKEEETYVIRLSSGSYEATAWADRQGEVVKEKLLGFTLLREKTTDL